MPIPNFALVANRIILKKSDGLFDEAAADGTILPGHLCQLQSDGGVVVHATSGGDTEKMIAREAPLNSGKGVLDAYSAGDTVFLYHALPGDELLMYLAAGQNVAEGATLKSNGAGKLIAYGGSGKILFIALAALNLSASGAVDTFIPVRAV